MPTCMSIHMSRHMSIHMHVHMSIHMSRHMHIRSHCADRVRCLRAVICLCTRILKCTHALTHSSMHMSGAKFYAVVSPSSFALRTLSWHSIPLRQNESRCVHGTGYAHVHRYVFRHVPRTCAYRCRPEPIPIASRPSLSRISPGKNDKYMGPHEWRSIN